MTLQWQTVIIWNQLVSVRNLIETYKILTGKDFINSQNFFTLNDGTYNLQGHPGSGQESHLT